MGVGLHYIIVVFELIYRLCNLFLHYIIGFRINYVIISAPMVLLDETYLIFFPLFSWPNATKTTKIMSRLPTRSLKILGWEGENTHRKQGTKRPNRYSSLVALHSSCLLEGVAVQGCVAATLSPVALLPKSKERKIREASRRRCNLKTRKLSDSKSRPHKIGAIIYSWTFGKPLFSIITGSLACHSLGCFSTPP